MSVSKNGLSDRDIAFIQSQPLFFVATAAADGRVNVSPKGLDSLRVLTPKRIAWLSVSGSGNETAAHVAENGRMTLMFCAFTGEPLIVRVYGTARVVYPRDAAWGGLSALFPTMAGARQVFDVGVTDVLQSCGSGVPRYEFKGQRGEEELLPFYEKMGEEGVKAYWLKKNRFSIDGKPTRIDGDGHRAVD